MPTDVEDGQLSLIELEAAPSVESLELERIELDKLREQEKWNYQFYLLDVRRENERRRYRLQLIVICSCVGVMMAMGAATYQAATGGHNYLAAILTGAITTLASILCACVFPREHHAIMRAARRRAKAITKFSKKLTAKRKGSDSDSKTPE